MVKKLFDIKFPVFPGILLSIISILYYFIIVKDIFKYNYLLSFLFYKQEKFKVKGNTEIIYADHRNEHFELTKLQIGIEKLYVILFNKIFFVLEKTYPYFVIHHLNKRIRILHIGTIEFLSLFNIDSLVNYCKKNNIFLIATYHSFGDFDESIEMLKNFDLIITLSDTFNEELMNYGFRNVITNILPISYSNIESPNKEVVIRELGLNPNNIIFALIGGIREDKGFEFFIHSLNDLDNHYKDKIFLNFAGKIVDNTYDNISKLLPDCGIEYRLNATKIPLSDEEYVSNITASDALMIPYTRETINASGPLVEGAYRKIPIIGTDNGDIGFTINKWNIGFTFKHKNEDDLRNKIMYFVDNIDKINFNFDEFIKEHSPENFFEKHKTIYQDILNNKFVIDNYR